MSQGIKNIKH